MKACSWLACLLLLPILEGCGSGGCKNACTDGSTQCSGTQVQTCVALSNGCLGWSAATGCPGTQACSAATGACACTDACAAGSRKCSGTQLQACQAGLDGCLAWSAPANCPASQVCSASANACVADACEGVPAAGVCTSATTVSFCGVATGEGTPRVLSYDCAGGESCQVSGGKASCVLTAACIEGATKCADAATLLTCTGGAWKETACAESCQSSSLGAFCAASGTLKSFSGTVTFEAKVPNAGMTDWDPSLKSYYAPLFLVLSRGAGGVYDAVYTSAAQDTVGQFTIQVPATPGPGDAIVVVAAASAAGSSGLSFAVANPGFAAAGEHEIGDLGEPALWSWAWNTADLTPGQELAITEAMGSAAANVYFNLLVAYAVTYGEYGRFGPPAIVWIGPGANWSCGACFAPLPATVFGVPFDAQVWLGADLEDQPYWSDAVTSHELGHWAMSSFGFSPGEGGPHFFGKPTFPGQAWSEGWATWFSSDVRDSPIYYDKQGGSFFWVNIDSESYSSGSSFVAPRAADGLLQLLDENEVSAMLWRLSQSGATAADALFAALASPRMTAPTATRGYTRHQWSYDQNLNFINVIDTGEGAPCFADFLDAVDCAGFPAAAIDAATIPATRYPFPSGAPICQ